MNENEKTYDYLIEGKKGERIMAFPLVAMNSNEIYLANASMVTQGNSADETNTYVPPKVVEEEKEEEAVNMRRRVELRVSYLPFLENKSGKGEIGVWFNRYFKLLGGLSAEKTPGYRDETLTLVEPYLGFRGKWGVPETTIGSGVIADLLFKFPFYSEEVTHTTPGIPEKERCSMNAFALDLKVNGRARLFSAFKLYGESTFQSFYAARDNISEHYFEKFPRWIDMGEGLYVPEIPTRPRDVGGIAFSIEGGVMWSGLSLGVKYGLNSQTGFYPLAPGHDFYHAASLVVGLEYKKGRMLLIAKPQYTFWTTEPDLHPGKRNQAYNSKFGLYGLMQFGIDRNNKYNIFIEGNFSDAYANSFGIGFALKG